MKRKDILDKAERCVNGGREQDYGSPENNFKNIADLWSTYKGVSFSALDVAMMMALLKIARTMNGGGGTVDSFVDLAGYAACGGELWETRIGTIKIDSSQINPTQIAINTDALNGRITLG